jgi:hypothetical protein
MVRAIEIIDSSGVEVSVRARRSETPSRRTMSVSSLSKARLRLAAAPG